MEQCEMCRALKELGVDPELIKQDHENKFSRFHHKATKVYIVVSNDDYIPHVQLVTEDRVKAMNFVKEWASGWDPENQIISQDEDIGELFFSQKDNGSMEYAITLEAMEMS